MAWRFPRSTTLVVGRDLPHGSDTAVASPPAGHPSWARPLVESLALILVGVLVARVFIAEAYIVPTGSMATTLLGSHRDLFCPNCGTRFALGLDADGATDGRPVCSNCGHSDLATARAVDSLGDRLLVQKYTFAWRPPRRWEVAVFVGPGPEHEAYVKRVAGLPGEQVEIRDGDLWIDGSLARKTLEEVNALRVLVHDDDHRPSDSVLYPRWQPRPDDVKDDRPTGWNTREDGYERVPTAEDSDGDGPVDWLDYQHWEPDTLRLGPIRDFVGYNGAGTGGDHVIRDLILDFQVTIRPDCDRIELAIDSGPDRIQATLPIDHLGTPSVTIEGQPVAATALEPGLESSPDDVPRWQSVEASVVDRRLLIAIDGRLAFEPIDLETAVRSTPRSGRLAVGVVSGSASIRHLRVYRDVYYTPQLAGSMRPGHAVEAPYVLGSGEYFMLGDNSPVSNDSRFWSHGPIVAADALIGRPFLVHVPSQVMPVRVFGRDLFWIPDFREIRYIR